MHLLDLELSHIEEADPKVWCLQDADAKCAYQASVKYEKGLRGLRLCL